jgi:Flp pilus assembly protein TadG
VQLRRGNNAIEFALILPVLLTLIFGAMEYSWYFVQWEAVVRATSVGVRAGSQLKRTGTPSPTSTAVTVAKSTLTASFPAIGNASTVTCTTPGNNTVQCTLTAPYAPLIRYLPTPTTLVYTASMRLEDPT